MKETTGFAATGATRAAVIVTEVFWYLGWVALVLSVGLLIAVSATDFHVKYTRAPLEITNKEAAAGLIAGQDLSRGDMKIVGVSTLMVENYSKTRQSMFLIMPVMLAALYLFAVGLLRRFLKSIRSGSPFTFENASRLKKLGYIVMFSGPLYGIFSYIYARSYLPDIRVPGALVEAHPDMHVLYIIAGLIILVIGHVFDYGVRLKEDNELTI